MEGFLKFPEIAASVKKTFFETRKTRLLANYFLLFYELNNFWQNCQKIKQP
jgi:hypothetical protein